MPKRPCLTCGEPTDGARCEAHRLERKRARSREARRLGPCPQHGRCAECGQPPTPGNPLTWGHKTARGTDPDWTDKAVQIECRRCNSAKQDR